MCYVCSSYRTSECIWKHGCWVNIIKSDLPFVSDSLSTCRCHRPSPPKNILQPQTPQWRRQTNHVWIKIMLIHKRNRTIQRSFVDSDHLLSLQSLRLHNVPIKQPQTWTKLVEHLISPLVHSRYNIRLLICLNVQLVSESISSCGSLLNVAQMYHSVPIFVLFCFCSLDGAFCCIFIRLIEKKG